MGSVQPILICVFSEAAFLKMVKFYKAKKKGKCHTVQLIIIREMEPFSRFIT